MGNCYCCGEGERHSEIHNINIRDGLAYQDDGVRFSHIEEPVVIIDNGSGMIKAGFAGEEKPRCIFPSMIGKLKPEYAKYGIREAGDSYIGKQTEKVRAHYLVRSRSIECGKVLDWEDIEKIWNYAFQDELNVNTHECGGILLTDV